jgi:hypothetical protein
MPDRVGVRENGATPFFATSHSFPPYHNDFVGRFQITGG